ncbi:MoaD/ThiS family protein [Microbacterium sp. bgisy203]|uniref:MoaD/ThiS family protein n=1 Tax=Microbacterium sp. bgisy203 TaxID=3413799 RepID=UPI003D74AFEE
MPATTTVPVTVRYFAAAKAALGAAEERVDAADVVDLAALIARAPASARPVLERCSFLVDGVTTTDLTTPLRPGILVDVLPPFAGG